MFNKVELYLEDISKGCAKWLSPIIVGSYIPAIWHASIVIENFGTEFSYNCDKGITYEEINTKPDRKISLGYTNKSCEDIVEFLDSLKDDEFHVSKYLLFTRNCINFAERLCYFLLDKSIPKELQEFTKKIKKALGGGTVAKVFFYWRVLAGFSPIGVAVSFAHIALPYVVAAASTSGSSRSSRLSDNGSSDSQPYPQMASNSDYFPRSPRPNLREMYFKRYQIELRNRQ